MSGVFLAALWWLRRPDARRTLLALLCAGALPAAYEIFRAGYFGVLVPLPALTKEASDAVWTRGFAYFANFADPYRLWLPLMLLAALAAFLPVPRSARNSSRRRSRGCCRGCTCAGSAATSCTDGCWCRASCC